jgi:hypothetical protein
MLMIDRCRPTRNYTETFEECELEHARGEQVCTRRWSGCIG